MILLHLFKTLKPSSFILFSIFTLSAYPAQTVMVRSITTVNAAGQKCKSVEFRYDSYGRLSAATTGSFITPDSAVESYRYTIDNIDDSNLVRTKYFSAGTNYSTIENYYVKVGRDVKEIKEIEINSSGAILRETEYGYNNNGNMIKRIDNFGNGSQKSEVIYDYTSDGFIGKQITKVNGKCTQFSTYEYSGSVLRRIANYKSDSLLNNSTEYQYDSKEPQKKMVFYDGAGKKTGWAELTYDNIDSLICSKRFGPDSIVNGWQERVYDNSDHLLTKDIARNPDGSLNVSIIYEYDKQKRVVKKTTMRKDKIDKIESYEYF